MLLVIDSVKNGAEEILVWFSFISQWVVKSDQLAENQVT